MVRVAAEPSLPVTLLGFFYEDMLGVGTPLSGTPVANEGLVQDRLQENESQSPGVPTKTRVSCPNRYLDTCDSQLRSDVLVVGCCRGAFQEPMVISRISLWTSSENDRQHPK